MQSEIAVISPSSTLTSMITDELKKQNLNIVIKQAFNESAVNEAEELLLKGVKVLISRGNTARILRDNFDVPIVDIAHTFFDCYNAYNKARLYSDKIAFLATSVEFEKIIRKSSDFLKGAEIIPINLLKEGDTEIKLREMADRGIEVAIGGLSLEKKVRDLGIKYVMSEVETESIKKSISEALHLLKIEKEREEKKLELKNKYETINSIFNCVSEGIISLDENGSITNINKNAEELLGSNAMGKNISRLIPSVEIIEAVKGNKSVTGLIASYQKNSLVVNIEPVKFADSIAGAVATLQRSKQIQAIDQKIRHTMLKKGHIADKSLDDIVGESDIIQATKELAKKYAAVDSTVLIFGETGTGKELFAKSIHNLSNRRKAPFVAINCASLPANLFESEIFGYVKGAFTGANSEGKAGIFELAHGGTIFLDEISEASPEMQLKLLRVIQERKVVRLGDDNVIPVDVRIIAATNKDLKKLVKDGRFREDFYYRICVLELKIPSLRERREDISLLIRHFADNSSIHISGITNKAVSMLSMAEWPGNIRQLSNAVERLMVMCSDDVITSEMVEKLTDIAAEDETQGLKTDIESSGELLRERKSANSFSVENATEADLIKNALIEAQGNRKIAAQYLGISTSTLWRKMKNIDIDERFLQIVKYKTN